MVLRIWHGWASDSNAYAYETLLQEEILVAIGDRHIPDTGAFDCSDAPWATRRSS